MKPLHAFLPCLIAISLAATAATAADDAEKSIVVLAGDSTVTDAAGWGAAFAKHLGADAKCINLAAGGRSSKSFRDEGRWDQVIAAKPDFVLIQFGHNDMPGKGPERETDPETTFHENMTRYVHEAREAGATPILVTSMTRRIFVDGKIQGELKPWADATRKVAVEEKVPLVDLFTLSVDLMNELGPEKAGEYNFEGKKGGMDRTHLDETGAAVMADIIVAELRKVAPDLAKLLK